MTGGCSCARTGGDRELAADLVQDTFEAAARAWDMLREHASQRQRAWLLSTLAHKNISDFRHQQAFRRRQPAIHARYHRTAADTEAEALNAVAVAAALRIIEDTPPRQRKAANRTRSVGAMSEERHIGDSPLLAVPG